MEILKVNKIPNRKSFTNTLLDLALKDKDIIAVTSDATGSATLTEFAKTLPKHKILFGTDTPPNEPGMWLRLLEVLCSNPPQGLNLDEDTLEDYLGNNVARMIGLEPSPPPRSHDEACERLGHRIAPQPVIPLY